MKYNAGDVQTTLHIRQQPSAFEKQEVSYLFTAGVVFFKSNDWFLAASVSMRRLFQCVSCFIASQILTQSLMSDVNERALLIRQVHAHAESSAQKLEPAKDDPM
jgi:hypothetical protein